MLSHMRINQQFLAIAQHFFNPYSCKSGTEHVAWLLYSLVRMTRPRVCVEYGSGYSTMFLLAAMADNDDDIEKEVSLLRAKTAMLEDLSAFDTSLANPVYKSWLDEGGLACETDPGFYMNLRASQLYSFEGNPEHHKYVRRMTHVIA